MNINKMFVGDLTDAVGASILLSKRFEKPFSVDSISQLVKQQRLRAFMFIEGELVERQPSGARRGKDLIFLKSDLLQVPMPGKPGRPRTEEAKVS
jgi:hypothetical protein